MEAAAVGMVLPPVVEGVAALVLELMVWTGALLDGVAVTAGLEEVTAAELELAEVVG